MTVHGTLKADGLAVAKITIDFLQNPVKIHALAALVHTRGGQTLGWTEGNGAVFSTETMAKLQELREAMERDIAQHVFADSSYAEPADPNNPTKVGGLGEHLGVGGAGEDAPSI